MSPRRLAVLALFAITACDERPPRPIEPCPILQTDCQQRMFLATDRLRGHLWDPWSVPPSVEVVGPEEYSRRSQSRARDLQRVAASAAWSGALHGLGVLAPELDIATADHEWFSGSTIASYIFQANRVTIVNRGSAMDELSASQTLVHEYVHALQDRDLGLDWSPPLTTDEEMVRTSLIEGEAVLFDQLARLEMEGKSPADLDWQAYFSNWLAADRMLTPVVLSAHSHVRLGFPYPLGGALLAQTWWSGGVARVQRLFGAHPRTFLELMLAAEGRGPAEGVPSNRVCPNPGRLGAVSVLSVDTLGAALFYAHLLHTFGLEQDAWESALSWRTDRIWLLNHSSRDRDPFFWRVHAPDIGSSALGSRLRSRVEPPVLDGEDVLMWQGLDPEQLDEAKARLTCAP